MNLHTIEVEGTGHVINCAEDETVLHAALRQGLGFPYECGSGCCGTCQFLKVAGNFHDAWADAPGLSERARRRSDRMLACQSYPRSASIIRVALEDARRPLVRPQQRSVRLSEIVHLTPNMAEFVLQAEGPAEFLPGQYVLLSIPGVTGARAYSMCNLPNAAGEWRLIVKRKLDGALTNHLFDHLKAGDGAQLCGPYGMAYLDSSVRSKNVWCISGGSGLSPALSVVRGMLDYCEDDAGAIDLFYGGRGPSDIVDPRRFADIAARASGRLRFHAAVSDHQYDWPGESGFIHDVAARRADHLTSDMHVFVAGPPVMVRMTLSMLETCGVTRERIHFDTLY